MFGWSGPQFAVQAQSYADIDASRIDTALQSVAVHSAVDLIAGITSELPAHAYRGRDAAREEIALPSWLADPAGDGQGMEDWGYQVLVSWLLRGNMWGRVLDRAPVGQGGYLKQVDIFHPDCVSGFLGEDGRPVWVAAGMDQDQRQWLHRRVNPMPGQVLGLSPIAYHASTIGVSLASVQFGWQWFADGAHPSAVLSSTERDVNETLAKQVKKAFMSALRGTREPVVIDRGWKYERVQLSPNESQFLETMGYSEAQCARMFGPGIAEMLGYAVKGASLTYSNIQDRGLHLLTYALNKWFRRYERLLSAFLPRPQYVLLDRDAILETNTLQRYQAHASALDKQWKVINEVRKVEKLPPVPWGDVPVALPAAEPEPDPVPEPEPDDVPSDEDDDEDDQEV